MFLGDIQGLGFEVLPEFAAQGDALAARGEAFEQQRFKPRVFFMLLRFPEQRAEILADVAVTFGGKLFVDEGFQGFRERYVTVVMASLLGSFS